MAQNMLEMVRRSYGSPPSYGEAMAGVPENHRDIRTVGDLLEINYKVVGARDQLRRNLLAATRRDDGGGEGRYPGIIGFDEDVLPALDRAILAEHDMLLVGQMGQAKTRIAQGMAERLLSPMPIIRGSITNDTPMDLPAEELATLLEGRHPPSSPVFHVSPESAGEIRDNGLETPVTWVDGTARSRFLTATPDMSVKDMVGYIDAIKVAKGGIEMYRIESYSPGQLMQAKHGIFCMDELPVLDPRKQVALLSVLQEGRFTTGSYPVVFEPRTVMVATANPMDYTHSGRIIEPLSDRLRSHIHTRYPRTIRDETGIIWQEARLPGCAVAEPVLEMLAGVVRGVRGSEMVNQEKGVSVRFGISGMELLVAEATRARPGEEPCPRPSDFGCLAQVARFELSEIDDTVQNRLATLEKVIGDIRREARILEEDPDQETAGAIKGEFGERSFVVSQDRGWNGGAGSYAAQLEAFPILRGLVMDASERLAVRRGLPAADGRPASGGGDDGPRDHPDGIRAVATEMVLEQLCWSSPRVLERRDAGYVPAP